MSWSRSSRLGLAALLLVLIAAVGVVSGVSVTAENVPEAAEEGEQITIQVELQDLYAEQSSWGFDGRTGLENATWTITQYQGDTEVGSDTFQGSGIPNEQRVQIDQSGSNAPDRLVVEITGTVPSVDSFSYADPATFRGAELARVGSDGASVIQDWQIHHYTTGDPGSQAARTAIDDANATIQAAAANGTDVSNAESTLQDAMMAYDSENFADAVSLASDAESQAQSSGSGDDSGGSTDGGSTDSGSTDGGSTDSDGSDGGTTDGSGDGGSSDGSTDSGSDDGSTGSDGSGSQTDGSGSGDGSADGSSDGNASSGDSGGSDDGGLLVPLLYGLLGLLILGAVGGGLYWYQQKNQGPSRDPLG